MKKILFIGFLALTVFVLPSVSVAQSPEDIQAKIAELTRQIQELQTQLRAMQGGDTRWCHTFNSSLRIGDSGSDVQALKAVLTKEGFLTDSSFNFDEQLASAVSGFQEKYRSDVLAPYDLQRGTGYVGPTTRAKLNTLYGCNTPRPFPQESVSVDLQVCRDKCSNGPVTQERGYTTFTWTSGNAATCSASGDTFWSGSKPTSGSEKIWTGNEKTGITTYVLACTDRAGNASSDSVTISFTPTSVESLPVVTMVQAKAAGDFEAYVGEAVYVTGRNLAGSSIDTTRVFFGGKQASITQLGDASLQAIVPDLPAGVHEVYVLNESGQSAPVNVTVYRTQASSEPSVDYVQSPAQDPNELRPGERAVVYGKNLNDKDIYVRMIGKAEDQRIETRNHYNHTLDFTIPHVDDGQYDLFLEQEGYESNKIKVTVQ